MPVASMGIFGSAVKKRGLFGGAPEKKPAFFGQGGTGRNIAGHIGDALLQMNGMQPIYAPTMQNNAALASQAQSEHAKRFAGLEDYEAKKKIDQRYDKPPPTSFERLLDAAGIMGDQRTGMLRQRAQNDAMGAPVAVDTYDDQGRQFRQYVRPSAMGGGKRPQIGEEIDLGGGQSPLDRASSNVIPQRDVAALRKAMGDTAYIAWRNKHGLVEER